jgi:hypothetical protein
LCKELRDAYAESQTIQYGPWAGLDYGPSSLLDRADAALATPPAATREAGPLPQAGLTDEQLLELAPAAIDGYDSIAPGEFESETGTAVHAYGSELIAFARAVLARWGGAAVQPVPVSERPWERPGWLDEEGRCWFGSERNGCIQAVWSMRMPIERISHQRWCAPHWALPVPAADKGEGQGNG